MASFLDWLVTPNSVLAAEKTQAETQRLLDDNYKRAASDPTLTAGVRAMLLRQAGNPNFALTDNITGNANAIVVGTEKNINRALNDTAAGIVGGLWRALPWWVWIGALIYIGIITKHLWLPILKLPARS